MKKQYILFDLDGTLTNSKEGITKSVQYALSYMGIEEPDLDKLECYIGPALDESFQQFHGMTKEQVAQAIKKYRERYSDVGLFENAVYEGMEECLRELKNAGKTIALATCKPEVFAIRILEHFNLMQYFDVAVGAGLDGSRKHKDEVINEVYHRLLKKITSIENEDEKKKYLIQMKADSIMVGDRKQDILGAKECGIESVGVRFGFAKDGELEDAGADYIVETTDELKKFLLTI